MLSALHVLLSAAFPSVFSFYPSLLLSYTFRSAPKSSKLLEILISKALWIKYLSHHFF